MQDAAASRERHMLGFFIDADGKRRFDRFHLLAHGDRWDGEILRLTPGRSDAIAIAVSGCVNGAELELDLDRRDRRPAEALRVRAETPDIDAGYIGTLDLQQQPGDVRTRTAYVLEEAPAVRLDPSPTHGWGTVAVAPLAKGAEVLPIRGPFSAVQTPYSFRTSNGRHVEPTGYGHFVNHACEPSCEIVYRPDGRPVLVARRDLPAGTEITFDYTATEGKLANSFACLCPADAHKI